PQTAFVASFLGRINWLAGELNGAPSLSVAGKNVPCAARGAMPGGRVKVGVRPEDVEICADGCLEARVVGRDFLGDSVIVRMTLADGTPLVADQRAPLADAAVGQQVRVGWKPEAVHLFPPDDLSPEREAAP